MNVSSVLTKYYANVRLHRRGENKPKQTQSKPVPSAVEWANSPPILKISVLNFIKLCKILTTYEISF